MTRPSFLFTSESVSEGHPDKVCDRISDEIVDLFFRQGNAEGLDPYQIRVACETLATTNRVVIAGEVRGPTISPAVMEEAARKAIKDIGYEQDGFHWRNAKVEILLHAQSADIAQGVDAAGNKDEGAGDQGIMFGYACTETPELMPAPIYYSHKILQLLSDARRSGAEKALGPDAKSQVTVRYENGKPMAATQIVVSHQHVDESLTSEDMRALIEPYVRKALPEGWLSDETVWHINPTGKFFIGGPDGDCGLTGRKIIVDTYGGAAPHGGGAFSGKDPTKVDRSAAYAARYLAKNVVKAGLADRCTIQLSYAIGVAKPLSIYADLHGTGHVEASRLEPILMDAMNLSPRGIREHLKLNKPIYARTSSYGHFGRTPDTDGGLLLGSHRPLGAIEKPSRLTSTPEATDAAGGFRRPKPGSGGVYGRRTGRKLHTLQSTLVEMSLPRLAIGLDGPLDRATLFPDASELRLEIGFGGGEHLAHHAEARPTAGFIGCEPFRNGIAKFLELAEGHNLANVRVFTGDAALLIDRLPEGALAGVDLFYPDPWPKRRHRKRRFVSDAILNRLARAMAAGASLRFATDIDDYAGWTLARVIRSPFFHWTARTAEDWRHPWPGWPSTRYEAKALREGRSPSYLTFCRNGARTA